MSDVTLEIKWVLCSDHVPPKDGMYLVMVKDSRFWLPIQFRHKPKPHWCDDWQLDEIVYWAEVPMP